MPDAPARFQDRTAVVFGGCGFIGSRVVKGLLDAGAHVVSFDSRAADEHRADVIAVQGDITDAAAVESVVEGADHIFALAGGLGALRSVADPVSDLMSSCMAQIVLLEAVRAVAPTASVVLTGSRLEYGPALHLPVDEQHPLRPDSPYAIHKAACSAYYQSYSRLYGLHTAVLRLPNPYGVHVRGSSRAVGFGILNLFVDTALDGGRIHLYGGGTQLRDFIHVSDVVEAALAASVVPEAAGEVFNVGSGQPCSLREAADVVLELCGSGSIDCDAPWPPAAAAVETGDFYFDISKAVDTLGWRPRVGFRDGMSGVVEAMRQGHRR
jgi:UDP-glucose 4-epimerase